MTLNGYCIYDRKAGIYHAPWFAVSDGAAVRSFADLANDPNTTVGRHPTDYVLFRCSTFDDANGSVLSISPIHHVSDANTLVRHNKSFAFTPNDDQERSVNSNGTE